MKKQIVENGTTLKQLSQTRWASRKRALSSLVETYEFVLETLEHISLNDKSVSGANARPLLKSIEDFEFLFVLHVLNEIYERTGILSETLQKSELEMDGAQRSIEATRSSLKEILTEENFGRIYKFCIDLSTKLKLDQPSLPRQGRTSSRLKDFEHLFVEQTKFATVEDKYKSLYLKIIETNVEEINNRFKDDSITPILTMAKIFKYGKKEDLE